VAGGESTSKEIKSGSMDSWILLSVDMYGGLEMARK
jgi:hypothetical protein